MTETYEEFKSQIESEISKLKVENKKILKLLKKLSKEQEPEDKPKRVNGFAKPMKMSQSLCEFLGVDPGTEMARTDVTKKITEYVKSKGLQNPENKRELILDDKLKTIIHNEDNTQVTFFNLQKYMSKHYIKEGFVEEKVPKVEIPMKVEDIEVPQTPKSVPSKVKKVVTKKVKA
tara:strand:+ start:327 stop:851 length:525 start_codon:yes stop_codon:yes gene_type:complete